jgi:hypothetical protein
LAEEAAAAALAAFTWLVTAVTSFAAAASSFAGGPRSAIAFGIDGFGLAAPEIAGGATGSVTDEGVGVALRVLDFGCGDCAGTFGSGRYQLPA